VLFPPQWRRVHRLAVACFWVCVLIAVVLGVWLATHGGPFLDGIVLWPWEPGWPELKAGFLTSVWFLVLGVGLFGLGGSISEKAGDGPHPTHVVWSPLYIWLFGGGLVCVAASLAGLFNCLRALWFLRSGGG